MKQIQEKQLLVCAFLMPEETWSHEIEIPPLLVSFGSTDMSQIHCWLTEESQSIVPMSRSISLESYSTQFSFSSEVRENILLYLHALPQIKVLNAVIAFIT